MGPIMRDYSATTLAYLARPGSVSMRVLLWITAREFSTGNAVTLGVWTGPDHRQFVIRGQTRMYYGIGGLLRADPIIYKKGLQVRTQSVTLGGVSEQIRDAMLQYDLRHARVEMHRALYDAGTIQLVDEPHRVFAGFIDRVRDGLPVKGGVHSIELTLASAARSLTRGLSRYRSDAGMQARAPGDTFRKYTAFTEKVEVPLGRGDRTTPAPRPGTGGGGGGGGGGGSVGVIPGVGVNDDRGGRD